MVDEAKCAGDGGPVDDAAKDLMRTMLAEIANGNRSGGNLRAKGSMGVIGQAELRVPGFVAAEIGRRAELLEDWVSVIDGVAGLEPELFMRFMEECCELAEKYARMELAKAKVKGR